MNIQFLKLGSTAVLVAAMAMVGCSKQDQANVKTTSDDTVAKVKQDAKEVGAEASKGMAQAKEAMTASAQEAKDAAKVAGDKIGVKVSDAVITTTVKAELAKDKDLSALKINVDTENGRVALHGTAPSKSARDHASALAAGVKGVVNVDNQLMVEPGNG
ncbi:MAG: BON domain-containing protein [Bacteriovorax sp.]|nr:BON domain-containing protein [Rhizobacter sp.]